MQLTLIRGRAAAGKTAELMRRVGEALQGRRRVLILVPEQTTLSTERQMLEILGLPGSMQAHIMSPKRLARDVFSRVGGSDRAVIDERGRSMVLQRVSDRARKELTVLGPVSGRVYFAQHVSSLFSDLKRFQVGPEALRRVGMELPAGTLSAKLRDLSTLMEAYEDWMQEHHHLDDEDMLWLLAQKLLEDDFWREAEVFIDGFDYLPPGNIAWISSLVQIAHGVTVTLCVGAQQDADREIFAAGDISARSLVQMAGQLGCPVKSVEVVRAQGMRPAALEYLEQALYAYPAPEPVPDSSGVYLLSPEDPEEETEQAARLIDSWVRREGLRYRDIVIVCGDLSEYSSRLKRVFSRFEIPLFLDERRGVLQHPLVHFAISALQTVGQGYRSQDFLDCIKTGLCGLSRQDLEMWERQIASTAGRGKRALFGPWRAAAQGIGDLTPLEPETRRIRQALEPLEEAHRSKRSAGTWARLLEEWMLYFAVPEQLQERCLELDAMGDRDAASETAQVFEEWSEMLGQMTAILGEAPMDALECAQALESGFVHAEVGVLPVGLDRVLCGDIGRTKPDRVKRLLILGAHDGVVPARYTPQALLSERDMAILQDSALVVGRDAGIRLAQSQFGIYHVIAYPTQMLVLSCPHKQDNGAALRPSPVIERVRSLLDPQILRPDPWLPSNPQAMLMTAAQAVRAHARTGIADERLQALLQALEDAGCGPQTRSFTRIPEPGQVEAALLGRTISVSRLEEYARCPFAWFAGSVLRPEEWDEGKTNAAGAGIVLHEAVARFGWKVRDEKQLPADRSVQIMDTILEEIFREEPWSSRSQEPRERFLMERIRLACLKTAQLWSEQSERSDFRPTRFEEEFGKTLPGMRMTLEDGSVVDWTGMIDRVDVYRRETEDVLRIVDYKSGVRKLSAAGVAEGWQLQLWVYLETLCRSWEQRTGRKAVPGGVYYAPLGDDFANLGEDESISDSLRMQGWVISDGDVLQATDRLVCGPGDSSPYISLDLSSKGPSDSQVKSPQAFEALLSGAVETGRRLAQNMKNGRIPAEPLQQGQQSACEYCQYKALCALQGEKKPVHSRSERQAMQELEQRREDAHGQDLDR